MTMALATLGYIIPLPEDVFVQIGDAPKISGSVLLAPSIVGTSQPQVLVPTITAAEEE